MKISKPDMNVLIMFSVLAICLLVSLAVTSTASEKLALLEKAIHKKAEEDTCNVMVKDSTFYSFDIEEELIKRKLIPRNPKVKTTEHAYYNYYDSVKP